MDRNSEFRTRGRAALLAGAATHDVPPVEDGARWGAAAVLRPRPPVLGPLTELATQAGVVAGAEHWAHEGPALHVTLRTLERYRGTIPVGDQRRVAYAEALGEAAAGLVRVELLGVSPHPGGVLALGYPVGDGLSDLQARFAARLRARGVAGFEDWSRDLWYVSLVHFAGPLRDPAAVVAWCDERRDVPIGVAELSTAEIVRWRYTGTRVRAEVLHETPLLGLAPALGSQ